MLPWVALVKSDVNFTIPEPLLGFVDSLNDTDRFTHNDTVPPFPFSFIHSQNEAVAGFEAGEFSAVVRIGRNLSTHPHYRLLWRAATSNGEEDSTLDIELDTNNQEIRFDFQRGLISYFKVSFLTSLIRELSSAFLLDLISERGYRSCWRLFI